MDAAGVTNITLYHYPLSRSMRVLFLLNELGVQHEVKRMKLLVGEAYMPEFMKLNPNHAVPVVTFSARGQKDLVVMAESSAILRFFGTLAHPVPLAPSVEHGDNLATVADWERWFAFANTTMDSTLWNIRVINDLRGCPEAERALLATYCDKWNNEISPQLEQRFQGNEFASEWGFSVLDCVMFQNLQWSAKYARAGLLNPLGPATMAYLRRIASRPACKRATEDASLFEQELKKKSPKL